MKPIIEDRKPTEFEMKVYKACSLVPRGKVTTYAEIARYIKTKGYRAVGSALNKNPFAPKVPCHRVINSNGSIGGFASGCENKTKLLQNEGIEVEDSKIVNFLELFHHLSKSRLG